jgi:hypothetical protein
MTIIHFDKDKREHDQSAKQFMGDVEAGAQFIAATLDADGTVCFWHSDLNALTAIGLAGCLQSYFVDFARATEEEE